MRSRYTAYVLKDEPYLLRTWYPSTRPAQLALDEGGPVKWLGLKVLRAERGGAGDDTGIVEFVARFKPAGAAGCLHEVSRFVREHGEWFYVAGEVSS
jgi:SEC-C motif-containing protein